MTNGQHQTSTVVTVLPTQEKSGFRTALVCTVISTVFCLAVSVFLVADYIGRSASDPLTSEQYAAMKQKLFAKAADGSAANTVPSEEEMAAVKMRRDALKEEIQALDLQLRQEYFRQRSFARVGGLMLLAGFVVLLVSARKAAQLRPWIPMPEPSAAPQDLEPKNHYASRWSIAALGVLLVAATLAIGLSLPAVRLTVEEVEQLAAKTSTAKTPATSGEESATKPDAAQTPATGSEGSKRDLGAYPAPEELNKNWPRFRGPGGLGISAYENLPTTWDAASGKSIVWKTPVPLPGHNSPVVWKDRVFLTGASKDRREVYCFDAQNGKVLWTHHAKGTPASNAKPPKVLEDTGFAAPSIATDGRCLAAWFANGDIVCLDPNGKELWARSLGIPENSYGHATSPIIYKNLVLLQFDQASAGDGKSKAMALDCSSGKTVWEKPRKVPNSWATPIIINSGGRDQFITTADPWVIAYSPEDGEELWRVKILSGDQGISPVFAGGTIQVGNEYSVWAAIKPDGKGNVTKTHIAWEAEEGLPDTVSPLANDDILLLTTTFGIITCYDIKTGKMLWEEDLEEEITSSPSFVGKNVYIFSKTEDGKCWVIEPTREACKRISEASLAEPCVTSPAFQDGRFYIRGYKHLFCVGSK